jgi:integrase
MRREKGTRLWLEKRPGRDSVWTILDGKKKRSTGFPERQLAEAEQELARYIAETKGPEAYKAEAGLISVAEVLAYYVKVLAKNAARKNTPAIRRGTATRQIHVANLLTFWADKTVADVRTSICEAYEEHRKAMPPRRGMRKGAESISTGTIRQELKTLGRAITAWHGESPMPALPIVWKPDAPKARERYLERHEVAKLLRAARRLRFPHLARYILIGAYTGTRDDAMRRLRWVKASHDGWIDTARGILYRAGFAEEQTSKRRPPMILPDRLLGHFRRWRKADEAEGLSHVITYALPPARHPGAIRRAERLGRVARVPQPVGDIHKAWASTVAAAGLERDVTPHTLKHTAITWMLHAGKTIWEVAEDTGTSAKTIEEVYGHHRTVESRLARGKRRA